MEDQNQSVHLTEPEGTAESLSEARHFAILRNFADGTVLKLLPVPVGQSLEMDDNGTRPWLWPLIGTEWHLVEFVREDALATVAPYTVYFAAGA